MQVRATKISFIEGHRRKPGKEYDLNDPKNFDPSCMVDAKEPVVREEKATRQRKSGSFLEVFGEKPKASKDSKPAEAKASKATGDQDVI